MAQMKSLNGYEIVDSTARNKIDNLEISGENLLVSSAKYTKDTPLILTGTSYDNYIYPTDMSTVIPTIAGKEYIVQAKTDGIWAPIHGAQDSKYVSLWLVFYNSPFAFSDNVSLISFAVNQNLKIKDGVWKYTCTSSMAGKYLGLRLNTYNTDGKTSVTHKFWDFKIEVGNVPTAYSIAPSDIQRRALYGYIAPSNNDGQDRDIYFLL